MIAGLAVRGRLEIMQTPTGYITGRISSLPKGPLAACFVRSPNFSETNYSTDESIWPPRKPQGQGTSCYIFGRRAHTTHLLQKGASRGLSSRGVWRLIICWHLVQYSRCLYTPMRMSYPPVSLQYILRTVRIIFFSYELSVSAQ